MAYDKFTLLTVLVTLEILHNEHEYKGREAEVVDETLEHIADGIREMMKGDES